MFDSATAERIANDPEVPEELLDEAQLLAAPLIYYAVRVPTGKPYWTQCYAVEHKGSEQWMGLVGRLGLSQSWEWDSMLGQKESSGRANGIGNAVLGLMKSQGY